MSKKDSPVQHVPRVPETIQFPKEEDKIITLWKNIDVFRSCLKQSKGKPKYNLLYYDIVRLLTIIQQVFILRWSTVRHWFATLWSHFSWYH